MDKVECFKIKILSFSEQNNMFNISEGETIKELLCGTTSLIDEPTTIMADPFLFVHQDLLYLFYEDKKMYKKGVISMIYTKDLKTWSESVVVLEESCHLSYPWVFSYDNHIYMIPETCELKSIRLYEANSDLTNFSFVKTLLKDSAIKRKGFSYSDSSIYQYGGAFYMHTTVNDGNTNILKLFMSKQLDGIYIEHPNSPICSNNKYGRNAGSIAKLSNNIYRFAQDCVDGYGNNVHLIRIKEINPDCYEEEVQKENILLSGDIFYKFGGHHFNFVEFKNKIIVATDAKEYHYYFFQRVLNKIGLLRNGN